jgi:hypothetical protein
LIPSFVPFSYPPLPPNTQLFIPFLPSLPSFFPYQQLKHAQHEVTPVDAFALQWSWDGYMPRNWVLLRIKGRLLPIHLGVDRSDMDMTPEDSADPTVDLPTSGNGSFLWLLTPEPNKQPMLYPLPLPASTFAEKSAAVQVWGSAGSATAKYTSAAFTLKNPCMYMTCLGAGTTCAHGRCVCAKGRHGVFCEHAAAGNAGNGGGGGDIVTPTPPVDENFPSTNDDGGNTDGGETAESSEAGSRRLLNTQAQGNMQSAPELTSSFRGMTAGNGVAVLSQTCARATYEVLMRVPASMSAFLDDYDEVAAFIFGIRKEVAHITDLPFSHVRVASRMEHAKLNRRAPSGTPTPDKTEPKDESKVEDKGKDDAGVKSMSSARRLLLNTGANTDVNTSVHSGVARRLHAVGASFLLQVMLWSPGCSATVSGNGDIWDVNVLAEGNPRRVAETAGPKGRRLLADESADESADEMDTTLSGDPTNKSTGGGDTGGAKVQLNTQQGATTAVPPLLADTVYPRGSRLHAELASATGVARHFPLLSWVDKQYGAKLIGSHDYVAVVTSLGISGGIIGIIGGVVGALLLLGVIVYVVKSGKFEKFQQSRKDGRALTAAKKRAAAAKARAAALLEDEGT